MESAKKVPTYIFARYLENFRKIRWPKISGGRNRSRMEGGERSEEARRVSARTESRGWVGFEVSGDIRTDESKPEIRTGI